MLKIRLFTHFVHIRKVHTIKMCLWRPAVNMQCSEMHRLNMELDLLSLFVHSCTHWLRPRNPPAPHAFGLIYEGAIGQIDDLSL